MLAQARTHPTHGVWTAVTLMDHAWLFVLVAIPISFLLALAWAWLMRRGRMAGSSRTSKVYVSSAEEGNRASTNGRTSTNGHEESAPPSSNGRASTGGGRASDN